MIYQSSILRPDLSSSGLYSEIWHLNFCWSTNLCFVLMQTKFDTILFQDTGKCRWIYGAIKAKLKNMDSNLFYFYFFIFCFNTWILLRYIEFFIVMGNATPHPTPFLNEWSFKKKTRKINHQRIFWFLGLQESINYKRYA